LAKKRKPDNQPAKLPEYGELISIMQSETASILTDYIRQYIGTASTKPIPGQGIYTNFDRILTTQSYQELAWYDLYQELERDPHVGAVMSSAKLDVAGIPYDVSGFLNSGEKRASKRNQEIADFVKETLDGIGYFPQHLYNLMDALGKGFAVSEVIWGLDGNRWIIEKLINRPQRRFQFDAVDRSLKLRTFEEPYFGKALPPKKFIVHRVSAEWENPFGDALDQNIYWMWLFKRTVLKFWMQHLEVGASSIPIVQHPVSADAQLKSEALSIAQQIRSGAYGRIPENFKILWAEAQNAMQSAQTYENFVKLCDEQISKAIQGQTLTTDTGQSGTRAQGDVHRDTATTRDVFRAHGLESTLNATLIPWLVDYNFAEVDGYPQFRFDLEDPEDLTKEADIVLKLTNAGWEFDAEEVTDKFNWTVKKKEQKIPILGTIGEPEPAKEPEPMMEEPKE
jgi:phage gp29-like protein